MNLHLFSADFWTRRWFWCLILMVVALPYMVSSLPPLMDLPGHMARFHIIQNLDSSADLQRFYSHSWTLMGNLGVDLAVTALAPLVGVEKATWAVSLASLLLTAAALPALSKAMHGRVQPTVLLALPFLYAHNFHFGFLNYALSVALALWALVLWLRMERASLLARALVFVPVASLIWLCHAMGWGVFALCAGLIELQRQTAAGGNRAQMLLRTALRVWPVAVPLVPMLVWRQKGGLPSLYSYDAVLDKIHHFTTVLRDQSQLLDIITLAVCILGLFWMVREKIATFAKPVLWAVLGLWAAFLVMPTIVFGSAYADARLIHVAAMLTFLGLRWQNPSRQLVLAFACLTCLLFASRMAVTTIAWSRKNTEVNQNLTALKLVPRGARMLILVRMTCENLQWATDYQYSHLGDMGVVRRDAFVNSLWSMQGAQTLEITYNTDTAYHSDPSQFVAENGCKNLAPSISYTLRTFPRDRFDFVWIQRLEGTTRAMPADVSLLYRDRQTALYKVKRAD